MSRKFVYRHIQRFFSTGILLAILTLALGPTPTVNAATLDVDNSDPACDDAIGTPYCTIQAAIDAADAGDTLSIAAGTYSEAITIDKDLALRGAGDSLTIIEWPGGTVVTISDSLAVTQVSDVTIQFGLGENGGGIYNVGSLRLENSRVADNQATVHGGGIYTAGDMVLKNVVVEGNFAAIGDQFGKGGGIAVVINQDPFFYPTVIINDSTIRDNTASGGGGIWASALTTLTINKSHIDANHAVVGGPGCCIVTQGGGLDLLASTVTLNRSTVDGNEVISAILESQSYGRGGGIANNNSLLILNHSTVSNNSIESYANGLSTGGGLSILSNRPTLNNSTVSGNTNTDLGGGLWNQGTLTLNSSTVSNNEGGSGGGISTDLLGTTNLRNTIIGDQAPDQDCGNLGAYISAGYNIDTDNNCNLVAGGDQPAVAAVGLDALADYGGLTETHNLADGSPAIDLGNPAGCEGDVDGDGILDGVIRFDQRGNVRVDVPNLGNAGPPPPCDVGAVEYNLVLNGMFEDDKDANRLPDLWQAANLRQTDKFVCNKNAVHSGQCAITIKGNNTTKEVFQVIRRAGANGDPYELVVYSASRNAAAGSLDIVVRFELAGALVNESLFAAATGTHNYTRFVSPLVMAAGAYDTITVYAIRSTMTPAGRVFIDDVSLVPG